MKSDKLQRLKSAGWKVGNAADFLQLSEEESKLVAIKWSLMTAVKIPHQAQHVADGPGYADEIKSVAHRQNRSG